MTFYMTSKRNTSYKSPRGIRGINSFKILCETREEGWYVILRSLYDRPHGG